MQDERGRTPINQTQPTVSACRGCCCGTARKHPTVDHEAQLAQLRSGIDGVANLRTTDCLGACERSNVVVVSPSRSGRKAGGRPVWLGTVLDPVTVDDISAWLRAGGPGFVKLPKALARHRFDQPR